jgi:hypothetical protein
MIFLMLCKPVLIALCVRYSSAISTRFIATLGHFSATSDEPRGNSACVALKRIGIRAEMAFKRRAGCVK